MGISDLVGCSGLIADGGIVLVVEGAPSGTLTFMFTDMERSTACEQGRRVRYATCAQLVNELVEAADDRQLSRVVGRYGRLDLLCLDELGYVQIDPRGAELLFQIITEREERASPRMRQKPRFRSARKDRRRDR